MSGQPAGDAWRALVAFTTSNRGVYAKRSLPHLARACLSDPRLDLVVALDGDDPETRAVCAQWHIPLIYSEAREGVGLSKNRVLKRFPDYDYYFFLEDDVEVLDGAVFARHVALMRTSGIHHMSLFDYAEGRGLRSETSVLGQRLVHFSYGSAEFNAFTREGIQKVGGWHPLFAQYRRWGHTEHSYRFPRNDLAPAPFNVAVELAGLCIRHRPPSVTPGIGLATLDADQIAAPERELMSQALSHVPLQTLAPYHVENQPGRPAAELAQLVARSRNRYPLLRGADWRHAQGDYLVWRFETSRAPARRVAALVLAGLLHPSGIALRHAVKIRLQKGLRRGADMPIEE
ncbi:MAG TPA: glycosyltransferase family A protein [Solirubrobacteraceae bacterium]|jgi:hypothetical protein|nr:glycosyltransferase family A protein [Solirubrobacteraceae bacterium]